MDETVKLPTLVSPKAMQLNAHLSGNWSKLGWAEPIEFSPSSIASMLPDIDNAISAAFDDIDPATPRDFMAAIGLILTLPSKAGAEGLGDAVIEGYRMACQELPRDLLMQAVNYFMVENADGWRPAPPKLRSVVAEQFAARRKRYDRLCAIKFRAAYPEPVAPKPEPSPKPEYVDPATIGDALKFMHAKFAEADAKEGNASRKVDYTQGPLVPNMPAHADASDELRAFVSRRMG